MKKAIIKNLKLPYPDFNWDMLDTEENILRRIDEQKHLFGKPERWVLAKELMENGNPEEPEHWMWHSEHYEDSDIVRTEIRTRKYIVSELNELGHTIEVEKEESESWVLLKADYTIEIIDLDTDYDWLLSECHRKRKAEYPPITELGDALYWKEQGDDSKYIEYISKCDEVKKKYPKPIREDI